jgi:hypothetical protein
MYELGTLSLTRPLQRFVRGSGKRPAPLRFGSFKTRIDILELEYAAIKVIGEAKVFCVNRGIRCELVLHVRILAAVRANPPHPSSLPLSK